jgi:hypothetical protein
LRISIFLYILSYSNLISYKVIISKFIISTLGKIPLSKEIHIIEPHPNKENIILSADFEGNIIIWDILDGIVLNIFKEMAIPLL